MAVLCVIVLSSYNFNQYNKEFKSHNGHYTLKGYIKSLPATWYKNIIGLSS